MVIVEPGPSIGHKQLVEMERELKLEISLPVSLSEFLLRYNGGRPVPKTFDVPDHREHAFDVQLLYGVNREIESSNIGWASKTLRSSLGTKRIAFGCTDTDDQLVLDLRDGSVWFWDFVEKDPLRRFYRIASSHSKFLTSLRGDN